MTTTRKKLVLYTFPPVPNSYSMTPFGLKTESFLRINNIPYETKYTTQFGNNGTIPYLRIFELSSDDSSEPSFEEISDSNEIIDHLLQDPEFDTAKGSDQHLTKEQAAIGHAFLRMLEEHTTQTGFYYRYALNMPDFCEATELRQRSFMGDESRLGNFIFNMFQKKMPGAWTKKGTARGFVRYRKTNAVWDMACKDLKVLDDLLSSLSSSENNYFFDQTHPGAFDCTVFGHLSQLLYIRMDFPHQKYLKESCPNLLQFMENFKQSFFPDWEVLCQQQPNEALKADSPRMKKFVKKMKKLAMVGVLTVVTAVGIGVYFSVLKPSRSQEL